MLIGSIIGLEEQKWRKMCLIIKVYLNLPIGLNFYELLDA